VPGSPCNLKKIEVVQYQKDGQKDIDNHSGQHYNVEQFCVTAHVDTSREAKRMFGEYHTWEEKCQV